MPSDAGSRNRTGRSVRVTAALGVLLLGPSRAVAAVGSSQTESGQLVGIVAATVLLAILGYALVTLAMPREGFGRSGLGHVLLLLGSIGAVKMAALLVFPGLWSDVGTYQSWALKMAQYGPAHVYAPGYFLDYPPGYLYALWAAGSLAGLFHASGTALRVLVESPPIFADFALAAALFGLMRRSGRPGLAWAAMLMVALNPAMLFDSVVWGQSDSVVTLVMLLSVAAMAASRYELGWALAAVAVLVKPQGLLILPLLGLWTLLGGGPRNWIGSATAFLGVALIGIAPFQIGHRWDWIFSLYTGTIASYHETAVNAFNLMALIGGLRSPDTGTIAGVTFFTLGMSLLAPLYGFTGYTLWRHRSERSLYFAVFLALFGVFVLAPRMHERYVYPALLFAIPLALEAPKMMAVFGILTLTCLFNLAYVLHTLRTVVFLSAHDGYAMGAAVVNIAAFGLACSYGISGLGRGAQRNLVEPLAGWFRRFARAFEVPFQPENQKFDLRWLRADTIVLVLLLLAAAATRLWHLGFPHEIVFDEVHFVGQARHYLRGEMFLDPHPPLAKLVIAAGIRLFGDSSFGWRIGNALMGTGLVGVTYLLGRRIFSSRLAATLAGVFILLDGLFLVDSRIAVIDIVYLTLAAVSYLLLFRIVHTPDRTARRRVMPWLGVTLGLCVGSKLYIPALTFVLVMGFLLYALSRVEGSVASGGGFRALAVIRRPTPRATHLIGATLLVGATATLSYILVFLPHYVLGWWGGIEDLFRYYGRVIWYETSVAQATHPYASPWWTWPLMLRPIAYWQHFPKAGDVATVWGGANPILCWGALAAMIVTAVQAIERPNFGRTFLVAGYLGYLLIWVWVGRTLFLYHYMASLYCGYLALGALLARFWQESEEPWAHLAVGFTIVPVLIFSFGWAIGILIVLVLASLYGYLLMIQWPAGRLVSVVFVLTALILFIYFFPLWTGMSIPRPDYYQRMWLQGPGLRNWI